jgi:hypothetical protein
MIAGRLMKRVSNFVCKDVEMIDDRAPEISGYHDDGAFPSRPESPVILDGII